MFVKTLWKQQSTKPTQKNFVLDAAIEVKKVQDLNVQVYDSDLQYSRCVNSANFCDLCESSFHHL